MFIFVCTFFDLDIKVCSIIAGLFFVFHMNNTKQVIVVRHDLKMPPGKIGAQCAHAAMSFLTRHGFFTIVREGEKDIQAFMNFGMSNAAESNEWFHDSFTEVTLRVDSEEELMEIYEKSKAAGLETHLITDSGLTIFKGIPTKTCLAIGPHYADKIDSITGHLKPL